jgi:hypothetical protein
MTHVDLVPELVSEAVVETVVWVFVQRDIVPLHPRAEFFQTVIVRQQPDREVGAVVTQATEQAYGILKDDIVA